MQNANYGANNNLNNNQGNNPDYVSNNMSNNTNYAQNYASDYNPNVNMYDTGKGKKKKKKSKKNTAMIVVILVLSVVAIAMLCVLAVLFTDMFGKGDAEKKSEGGEPEPTVVAEVVTEDRRFVNSDEDLNLYSGPGTENMVYTEIPIGVELVITEYTDNGFAKTSYNNWDGYVETKYLSEEKPDIWEYDKTEVEDFVKDILYGYVDSINQGDFGILSKYLTGTAKDEARTNYDTIKKVVDSEEVESVECYDVQRLSKNSVTVKRDSVIIVNKKDGEVKEVTETYLTTVENTSSGMKAIKFEQIEKSEKIITEAPKVVVEPAEPEKTKEPEETEVTDYPSKSEYTYEPEYSSEPIDYEDDYYWYYTESEISSVVAGSLEWFVDSVNTGNTFGADWYFKGDILATEINNALKISNNVASEELIYVGCHTYKRLSDTQVSVIRKSIIQINYDNHPSETKTEEREYILENTGYGTYIIDINPIKK